MNERFPKELFSAHHDGEVTPGERIVVQRKLAASADAKRECEEIEQLSRLLQELPRESAPAEFSAQVMQAVEHPSRPAGDDKAFAKGRHLRRQWWTGVGTLTVSVAMLITMVLLINRSHGPDAPAEVAGGQPSNASAEGEPASVAELTMAKRADDRHNLANGMPDVSTAEELDREPAAPMFADKAGRGRSVGGGAGADNAPQVQAKAVAADEMSKPVKELGKQVVASPAPMVAGGAGAGRRFARKAMRSTDGQERLLFNAAVSEAQIDQIVSELETSGGKIAVVKLTVVDRNAGLQALQVLLERHQVRSPSTSDRKSRTAEKLAADGTVALYVEATSDQLASTLLELKQDEQFKALERQSPTTLAALDRNSRARVAWGMHAAAGRPAPKSAVYFDATRAGKDKKHAIKKPIGRPARQRDEEKAPDATPRSSPTVQRKLALRSRQVRLSLQDVATDDKAEEGTSAVESKVDRVADEPASAPPKQMRRGGAGSEALDGPLKPAEPSKPARPSKSTGLLRVLVLLEVAEPVEAKPAESAKPGDGAA